MTPDKRLDQLEPLVADVLQKVDRLIEGQGKPVELVTSTNELATNAKAQLEQINKAGQLTADGLAKLTVTVTGVQLEMRQRFDQTDQAQQEILALLRNNIR